MTNIITANNTALHNMGLHNTRKSFSIVSLTKNHKRLSKVLNIAFFMPKIKKNSLKSTQGGAFLTGLLINLSIKKQVHILKYERVKAWTKIPNLLGNKCSRLVAISDTRSPETKTGEFTTKYHKEGNIMPNTSNNPHTVEQFQLSKTFQSNAYIKQFVASSSGTYWTVYIVTTHDQTATIKDNATGLIRQFSNLDEIANYLNSQGVPEFITSLFGLNGGANNE